MDQLSVVSRKITNKRANRNLRKEGGVPAVIYGLSGVYHVTVSLHEFKKKFACCTSNTVLLLKNKHDGREHYVFIQDMQGSLIKDTIIHLDFLEVDKNISLKRKIPIRLTGAAPGVKSGGSLIFSLKEVSIQAVPGNIPMCIEVSIDFLHIGQGIKVSDLRLGNDVSVLDDSERNIVFIK